MKLIRELAHWLKTHQRWPMVVCITGLTLCLLLLCLHNLGLHSIWLDEGASLSIASQNGVDLFRGLARDGGNQALYYLVLHLTIDVFGKGTNVLRIGSALASAAVVPLTYGLGRRLVSRRVGFFAASFAAICAPLVSWGQMARGYPLSAALAAAAAWSFVVMMQRGRRMDVVVWTALSILLCYSSLWATSLVAIELVAILLWHERAIELRTTLIGFGAIVCGAIPLALLVVRRGSGQLFWLSPPTRNTVQATARFLVASDSAATGHWESTLLVGVTIVVFLCAIVFVLFDWREGNKSAVITTAFLAMWFALPAIAGYFVSIAISPVFLNRYFTFSIPAECLLLAVVVARIRPVYLVLVLFGGLVVLRATQIPGIYLKGHDNWRSATAALLAKSKPGDCVAFDANDGWVDFNYYAMQRSTASFAHLHLPTPVLPADRFGSNPLIDESYVMLSSNKITDLSRVCNRLWLVESHAGGISTTSNAIKANFVTMFNRFSAVYLERSTFKFSGVSESLFSMPK